MGPAVCHQGGGGTLMIHSSAYNLVTPRAYVMGVFLDSRGTSFSPRKESSKCGIFKKNKKIKN